MFLVGLLYVIYNNCFVNKKSFLLINHLSKIWYCNLVLFSKKFYTQICTDNAGAFEIMIFGKKQNIFSSFLEIHFFRLQWKSAKYVCTILCSLIQPCGSISIYSNQVLGSYSISDLELNDIQCSASIVKQSALFWMLSSFDLLQMGSFFESS